jgi:hypothetical protein
LRHILGKL